MPLRTLARCSCRSGRSRDIPNIVQPRPDQSHLASRTTSNLQHRSGLLSPRRSSFSSRSLESECQATLSEPPASTREAKRFILVETVRARETCSFEIRDRLCKCRFRRLGLYIRSRLGSQTQLRVTSCVSLSPAISLLGSIAAAALVFKRRRSHQATANQDCYMME